MVDPLFKNRNDAGIQLADELEAYIGVPNLLVLALPRGGVPVAFEVARKLHAPLDVFVVRKLGMPGQEELALGAIASGGIRIVNPDLVESLNVSTQQIEAISQQERRELQRRERLYRDDWQPVDARDHTIILVDDGLATGSTMYAAVLALRQHRPTRIVVAVPVASPETCDAIRDQVDDIVCAATPQPFYAVGAWYQDFTQVTDDEVQDLLHQAEVMQPKYE